MFHQKSDVALFCTTSRERRGDDAIDMKNTLLSAESKKQELVDLQGRIAEIDDREYQRFMNT